MDIDFGKDFNQREYWKYDIQLKLAILKVLQEMRVYGAPEDEPPDYHSQIVEQLK